MGPVAEEEEDCFAEEFVIPESIVAVAAAQNSLDTVWFIKVTETECFSAELVTDDYKHVIPLGRSYLKGHFLERLSYSKSATLFKVSKKLTYFYKVTVLYPYVEMEENKRGYVLKNDHYTDIICHLEQTDFAHL